MDMGGYLREKVIREDCVITSHHDDRLSYPL